MQTEATLSELAGQLLIAGYPAGAPPDEIREALRSDALGGVILFSRNLRGGPYAAAEEISELAEIAAFTPFVAIDQEGGRVQRLRNPVLELPPMRALGDRDDVELTRAAARALGAQLAAIGFNVDFAPVLDVATNPKNEVIGDRSFGADPQLVARHGVAFARGLRDAGVLGCGKHFPGHGDTREDSHFELPALPHDLARLREVELVPFRAAAGAIGSIMTAHIIFRALDPERPATLSRRVITDLLRGELGYDGLIVSDDLEMKAIADHYSVGRAAVEAVAAGCDLLLICKTVSLLAEARDALAEAASKDSTFEARLREAAGRARRARAELRCAPLSRAEIQAVLESKEARAIRDQLGTEV